MQHHQLCCCCCCGATPPSCLLSPSHTNPEVCCSKHGPENIIHHCWWRVSLRRFLTLCLFILSLRFRLTLSASMPSNSSTSSSSAVAVAATDPDPLAAAAAASAAAARLLELVLGISMTPWGVKWGTKGLRLGSMLRMVCISMYSSCLLLPAPGTSQKLVLKPLRVLRLPWTLPWRPACSPAAACAGNAAAAAEPGAGLLMLHLNSFAAADPALRAHIEACGRLSVIW